MPKTDWEVRIASIFAGREEVWGRARLLLREFQAEAATLIEDKNQCPCAGCAERGADKIRSMLPPAKKED